MTEVTMQPIEITEKSLAIVLFGPATQFSGFKAGEYYQVTLDPNMVSPSGEYIRFGFYEGDEIHGWQRVEAMTVAEILGPSERQCMTNPDRSDADKLVIRKVQNAL